MSIPTTTSPLAALRERLIALEYHRPIHETYLGSARGTAAERLEQALEYASGDRPLAVAMRLFLVGVPVEAAHAAGALGDALVEGLLTRGAIQRDGGQVRSVASIAFLGEAAAAQDFALTTPDRLRPDFVTPIAGTTRLLVSLTVPTPGGTALEIGTGQGLPIVAASGWARRAIGTDISDRALLMASLTRDLNDRANVELRRGSLFEPLEGPGEPFDCIISNPPFVISPADAGTSLMDATGDASITQRVLEGCPRHLREGGYATILGNWGHASGRWDDPLRRWTSGNGCDALAIQIRQQSARDYAISWRREMRLLDPTREPAPLARWTEMFEAMRTEQVSFGVVVLRRRNGTNWFHAMSRSTAGLAGQGGPQIRRWFEARTKLQRSPAWEQLAGEVLRLAQAVELSGRPAPLNKADAGLTSGTLRQTDGWPEPIAVDPVALSFLCACDGRTDVRRALAQVASAHRLGPGAVERLLAPMVPKWMEAGYLH